MKIVSLLILFSILIACSDDNTIEKEIPITLLKELNYPIGNGNSGDKITSLIGYGYDATGLCDANSARAKVINFPDKDIASRKPHYFGSTLLSGGTFSSLSYNMLHYPNASGQNNIALLSHIKSLMNLLA